MSRIRGKGNKDTEIALAKLLRANHITGWRRHFTPNRSGRNLVGRPDFTFPKQRVVVFVDGCFWHGCPKHSNPAKWLRKSSMPVSPYTSYPRPIRSYSGPRTGRAFWTQKLAGNIARDRFVTRSLRRQGWRVLRLWEHDLAKNPRRCVELVRRALEGKNGGKRLDT